jgi:hypothetical protein
MRQPFSPEMLPQKRRKMPPLQIVKIILSFYNEIHLNHHFDYQLFDLFPAHLLVLMLIRNSEITRQKMTEKFL